MTSRRFFTFCLVTAWLAGLSAPLVLFAFEQGFCAECTCCGDLFGGRVACVRGLEPPPGESMDCADEARDEVPVVPPPLGKMRPGQIGGAGSSFGLVPAGALAARLPGSPDSWTRSPDTPPPRG